MSHSKIISFNLLAYIILFIVVINAIDMINAFMG